MKLPSLKFTSEKLSRLADKAEAKREKEFIPFLIYFCRH